MCARTYTRKQRYAYEYKGICPRARLCLSKACLSRRPVEAQHYTLSMRIHQWQREGSRQAFILREPTFNMYLPLCILFFLVSPILHPHCLIVPIISCSYTSKDTPLPPLKKEAFLTVTTTQNCIYHEHMAI
ncbi:hypothetical protein XENOCAPTIV_010793 [Xenoophorus captivus]|uniref:Uncharacterized protein n=1 Tax=Xenoophorus captivus TaxID=1517983 RepID=A0ABV0RH76_9TELE